MEPIAKKDKSKDKKSQTELLKPLKAVIILGKTGVGKSSLANTLTRNEDEIRDADELTFDEFIVCHTMESA